MAAANQIACEQQHFGDELGNGGADNVVKTRQLVDEAAPQCPPSPQSVSPHALSGTTAPRGRYDQELLDKIAKSLTEKSNFEAQNNQLLSEIATLKRKHEEGLQERDVLKRKHEEGVQERDALKRKHEEYLQECDDFKRRRKDGLKKLHYILEALIEPRNQRSQSPASVEATDEEEDELELMPLDTWGSEGKDEIYQQVTTVLLGLKTGCKFGCMSILRMMYGADVNSKHHAYQSVRELLHKLGKEKTQLQNGKFISKDRRVYVVNEVTEW